MGTSLVLGKYVKDKETKNTVRYSRVTEGGTDSIYIRKPNDKELGEVIEVTVRTVQA